LENVFEIRFVILEKIPDRSNLLELIDLYRDADFPRGVGWSSAPRFTRYSKIVASARSRSLSLGSAVRIGGRSVSALTPSARSFLTRWGEPPLAGQKKDASLADVAAEVVADTPSRGSRERHRRATDAPLRRSRSSDGYWPV
jgi:hypothetical protein